MLALSGACVGPGVARERGLLARISQLPVHGDRGVGSAGWLYRPRLFLFTSAAGEKPTGSGDPRSDVTSSGRSAVIPRQVAWVEGRLVSRGSLVKVSPG